MSAAILCIWAAWQVVLGVGFVLEAGMAYGYWKEQRHRMAPLTYWQSLLFIRRVSHRRIGYERLP